MKKYISLVFFLIYFNSTEIFSDEKILSPNMHLQLPTGGKHLVIKTKDGNRIGFLLQDAEIWTEKIRAL